METSHTRQFRVLVPRVGARGRDCWVLGTRGERKRMDKRTNRKFQDRFPVAFTWWELVSACGMGQVPHLLRAAAGVWRESGAHKSEITVLLEPKDLPKRI